MFLLAQTKIHLNCESGALFSYVTNMENYCKWFPGVVSVTSADKLDHATPGKAYEETLRIDGRDATLTIEVKRVVANTLFYTEGNLQPLLPAMEMKLADDVTTKATIFELSYFSRNDDLFGEKEIIHSVQEDLRLRSQQGLSNLKAIMERR